MHRVPRVVKVTSLLLAALLAGFAGGRTTAEFSSTTANSANTFSAAASFGSATAGGAVVKSGAGSTSYTAGVLADSPVAYWRFGEPGGATTAMDASGNGRNGTVPTGATAPALGYSWSGLVGDGDTAYVWDSNLAAVTVPHADPLRLNGAFSIELWFHGRASGGDPEQLVFDKGGTPDANGWQLTYDAGGVFRLRRNNVAVASSTPILSTTTFMTRHVVLTFDGATARWYVDGALAGSSTTTFPSSAGTGILSIAANWSATPQTTIDEPALYATALSASRVNAHYRTGKMLSADVCEGYRVYANVTSGGSPATGVTSVTADLSAITPGGTAIPMTAGSYTVGGVTYGYRSASLRTGVVIGSYGYSLTWVDGSGSHTQSNLAATVADPTPITAQWVTGFEHGVASTPDVFSSNSGSGLSSSSPKSGAYARSVLKGTSSTIYFAKDGFTPTTALSFAIRLSSLPTADVTSLLMFNTSSTPLYLGFQASTSKLTLRWGSNTASVATTAVAAATWYTVDLGVDVSANPNTASWRIDEAAQSSANLSGAAQTVTDVRFGSAVTGDAFTAIYDDVVHSRALTDYPIGPARVLPSRPNGMGTHFLVDNFTQEDGTAVTSTSWERLDEAIMNTGTDGVRQNATAGYLGIDMQDTTEVCVRGVQAVVAQHKTASQANNAKASAFMSSTEFVVWSGDSTFVASPGPKTLILAPTAATGTWSPGQLNGVFFRLGNATDANPAPYWDALLLEYATSG